jgi:hypothetical protein
MNFSKVIESVIQCFIGEDVSLDLFSAEFGVKDGLNLNDWIKHEISEFKLRQTTFGIAHDSLVIRIDRIRQQEVTFSVLGREGGVAYQDTWLFGADGRLKGDGSQFEIVPKILFRHTGQHLRSLAIRSPRGGVVSVVPLGLSVEESRLINGLRTDEDGFSTFQMTASDDDLKGFYARFRIADDAGVRSTETVWMRGVDEPGFENNAFPIIQGRNVIVPGNSPAWALSVVLASGAASHIDHPRPGSHSFGEDIAVAILTDAQDHDWSVSV